MSISIGSRNVNSIFLGDREVDEVYYGEELAFERPTLLNISRFTVTPDSWLTANRPTTLLLSWRVTEESSPGTAAPSNQVKIYSYTGGPDTRTLVPPDQGQPQATVQPAPTVDTRYVLEATNVEGTATSEVSVSPDESVPVITNFRGSGHVYDQFEPSLPGVAFERWTLSWNIAGKPWPRVSIPQHNQDFSGDAQRSTNQYSGAGSLYIQRTGHIGDRGQP